MLSSVAHLSNDELVARVKHLAMREREATSSLIAHLAELDERRLYLAEGCSSLFTYCTQVLHLSEHAAYGRIEAARAVRRFPVIEELVARLRPQPPVPAIHLRCRAHNGYEAELCFGPRTPRVREPRASYCTLPDSRPRRRGREHGATRSGPSTEFGSSAALNSRGEQLADTLSRKRSGSADSFAACGDGLTHAVVYALLRSRHRQRS